MGRRYDSKRMIGLAVSLPETTLGFYFIAFREWRGALQLDCASASAPQIPAFSPRLGGTTYSLMPFSDSAADWIYPAIVS